MPVCFDLLLPEALLQLCFCPLQQASNTSLSAQLSDTQSAVTRERQLQADRLSAAEQLWQQRINELLGEVGACFRQCCCPDAVVELLLVHCRYLYQVLRDRKVQHTECHSCNQITSNSCVEYSM